MPVTRWNHRAKHRHRRFQRHLFIFRKSAGRWNRREGAQSNLDVYMSILDSDGIIVYEQTSDTTDNALTELLLEPGSYQGTSPR